MFRAGDKTNTQQYNETIHKKGKSQFFSLGLVEITSLPRKGFLGRVFLANHLASTDNLARTVNQETEHILTLHKKWN